MLIYSSVGFYESHSLGARYTGFGRTSLNPNVVGIVCVGLAVVALVLLQSHRSVNWQSGMLLLSVVVLMGHGITTLSRTAIVGFVVSFLLYLIRKRDLYTVVGSLVVTGGLVVAVVYGGVESRVFDVSALKDVSNRMPIWEHTLHESISNLAVGVGIGADVKFYNMSQVLFEHPHNLYLQALTYGGLIGLILYLGIYGLSFVMALKQEKNLSVLGEVGLHLLVYSSVVQIADIHSFFSRPDLYWFILWMPIGLLIAETHRKKKASMGL